MKIVLTAILLMGLNIYSAQAKTCVKDPSASYSSLELKGMQQISAKIQNKSIESFAQTLCASMRTSRNKGIDVNLALHNRILGFINSSRDDENYKEKIQSFWNKYNDKLVCNSEEVGLSSRKTQHLLKRLVDFRDPKYVKHFMNGRRFPLNPNAIENVNGKKETLLDYLNNIINDTQTYKNYDRTEIKRLVAFLKKSYGAKTAQEIEQMTATRG